MMNAGRNSFLVNVCYMFGQYFAPKGSDKICMMTTRLACIELLRARIGEWNHNLNVGLQTGYVLYRLPLELVFMDLDTFLRMTSDCASSLLTS